MVMVNPKNEPTQLPGDDPPKDACPLPEITFRVLEACTHTQRALLEMRETLISCFECPFNEQCLMSEQFQQLADQAVAEITEEWGW